MFCHYTPTETSYRIGSSTNTIHGLITIASARWNFRSRTRRTALTKVLRRVAPALSFFMTRSLRTMLERLMPVPNIFKKVDLILPSEERSADAMNRSISPSLIVEPALLV